MTGAAKARAEVDASISRLFTYAAWADKYDGAVHDPSDPRRRDRDERADRRDRHRVRRTTRRCSASSRSSRRRSRWATPSSRFRRRRYPLAATDLYSVLETSDVPAGVVNIVTGRRDALAKVLAEHDDVDAIWYFGIARGRCERWSGRRRRT